MTEAHTLTTANQPVQSGHEPNQVNLRRIGVVGGGLILLTGLSFWLMAELLSFLAARPRDDAAARLALPPPPRSLSQPLLQAAPAQDLQEFLTAEEAQLNSYGWVDQDAGLVRIPIQRAMQLLVERGVPTRDKREGKEEREGRSHGS